MLQRISFTNSFGVSRSWVPPSFHALLPLQLTPANNGGHHLPQAPDQRPSPRFYILPALGLCLPEVMEPQNPRMILAGTLNLTPLPRCVDPSHLPQTKLDSFPLLFPSLPDPRGHRTPRTPAPLLFPLQSIYLQHLVSRSVPKIRVSNLKSTKSGSPV